MTKIVSYKIVVMYTVIAMLFAILSIFFLFQEGGFVRILGYLSAIFSICFALCIFCFPNYIKYDGEQITIVNTPVFATNKFFDKKSGLIQWNCNIFVNEIESVELVLLSKDEREIYYGHCTVFNEYLKVNIKKSDKSKFIYTAIYSKKQYEKLLDIISSKEIVK